MLAAFRTRGALADLKTIAAAVDAVVPSGLAEPDFRHLMDAAVELVDMIREHPGEHHDTGLLDLEGRVAVDPMLATASLIAATDFDSYAHSSESRRYLAGMLLELAAFEDRAPDAALRALAQLVRVELNDADGRRPRLEGRGSLLGFIEWLDAQSMSSQYFTVSFRTHWHGELSSRIKAALSDPNSVEPEGLAEGIYQVLEGPTLSGDWRPEGFLCPVDLDKERLTLGAAAALGDERATRVPLAAWTEASVHYWDDSSIRAYVARQLRLGRKDIEDGRRAQAEGRVARLWMLVSGTHAQSVRAIQWETPGEAAGFPGTLTLDARWLKRRELVPSEGRRTPGTVWIPIPRQLRELLRELSPPARGEPVLRWTPPRGKAGDPDSGIHSTALQRALLWRLARDEDLGVTAAQWAAGDTLGVSVVPLYYDEFSAGVLARKIHAISHPWFGEHAPLPASTLPNGRLGAALDVGIQRVREFHATLRQRVQHADSLSERISAVSANIAHGLAASAGHRPSDSFAELRLSQLGPEVAVLNDKVVAPDWRCRPVAIAPSLWLEIEALACLLESAAQERSTLLGQAAGAALAGSGPLLLVVMGEEVRPFGVADFLADMPEDIRRVPNFARQLLNRALIGAVREASRVAQMGWHGTREGMWSEGSPLSVVDAARRLHKPLEKHMRQVGWAPTVGNLKGRRVISRPSVASWTACRRAEEKAFRSHVATLQRATAVRHSKLAREIQPRISEWLRIFKPHLVLDGAGRFRRAPAAGDPPVSVTAAELSRLERHISRNERQTERRAVARNLLSVLMRQGRRSRVVLGPIPRRVRWRFPARPNGFSWVQPLALSLSAELRHRFEDFVGEAPRGGRENAAPLPYAAACAGVIIYGGYPHVDIVHEVLDRSATLHRSRKYPGVLLVNVGAQAGAREDTASAGRSFAFHGAAALLVSRWHRQLSTPELPRDLDAEVAQLFTGLIPAGQAVAELIEVIRAERMLSMDGVARLVGSGQILPSGADAGRVVADHEDRLPPRGSWHPSELSDANPGKRVRPDELAELYRALASAAGTLQQQRANEEALRSGLIETVRAICGAGSAAPTAPDLVARFALALLERGGRRKRHLQLSTIRSYVLAIGTPLVKAFGSGALPTSEQTWRSVFQRVIYEASPCVRSSRADSVATFLWVVTQELDLPINRFDAELLDTIDGSSDAGYATGAELKLLNEMLAADQELLRAADAGVGDIEDAHASQLAVSLMSVAGQRPGEVAGLRWKDIQSRKKGVEAILVRGSRYLGLKTPRARRRVTVASFAKEPDLGFSGYRAYAVQRMGSAMKAGHCMWQLGRARRLGRDALFARPSLYLKRISGRRNARPYWIRKAVIGRLLGGLMASRQADSLWEIRTFLASIGHASVRTTLGHYIHDPTLPFARWFRAVGAIDQKKAAALAGRGGHAGIRRGAGRRGTSDSGTAEERVAAMLAEIRFEEGEPRDVGSEVRIAPTSFQISHDETDRMLRLVAEHRSVAPAVDVMWWPKSAGDRLEACLDQLASVWRISILPCDAGVLHVIPPRKLNVDGGLKDFLATGSPVVAEMADRWVQFSAIPGVPPGIPGTPQEWEKWGDLFAPLDQVRWVRRDWGAYSIRAPEVDGGDTSLWPLLRWGLLVAVVRKALVPSALSRELRR